MLLNDCLDTTCDCRNRRRKDGKFLFVEEQAEGVTHTVFNQPAGHVEAGETVVQAAVRETMEETGYEVEIHSLLGIYTYTLHVS